MNARPIAAPPAGHELTTRGLVIHAFRKVDGVWRCHIADCAETRDKHGKKPKARHLNVVGK